MNSEPREGSWEELSVKYEAMKEIIDGLIWCNIDENGCATVAVQPLQQLRELVK